MVKKIGYFSKISLIMDEAVCNALYDYANALNVTPDLVIEGIIERQLA